MQDCRTKNVERQGEMMIIMRSDGSCTAIGGYPSQLFVSSPGPFQCFHPGRVIESQLGSWAKRSKSNHENQLVEHLWSKSPSPPPPLAREVNGVTKFAENSRATQDISPDHLLLDSAPNLGPLISCWEINKFENCWYKCQDFRVSKAFVSTIFYICEVPNEIWVVQYYETCPIIGDRGVL
jgi:hypothetical protein